MKSKNEENKDTCKCHCHHEEIDNEQNETCDCENNGKCSCEDGMSDLLTKIDEITLESAKYKDSYLRAVAELDTYKRRVQREIMDLAKFAVLPLVEDMLPVLDNLELAMANIREHLDSPAWAEGIEMLAKQIRRVFTDHGIIEIDPLGEDFDPTFHECVAHEKFKDVQENKIAKVMRKGYKLDSRLIRPASVVVSSGISEE